MPYRHVLKYEKVVEAVRDGRLPEESLNRAVRNILTFVHDAAEAEGGTAFDRETAREKAARFAKECAVLLKNNGLLPLCGSQKIVLVGEFAKNVRYQGAGSSHIRVKHPVSALDDLGARVLLCGEMGAYPDGIFYAQGYRAEEEETDETLFCEAVRAAKAADVAVVFAGLPEAREIEGNDREDMGLPKNQNALIHEIAKVQENTVVVLHGGAPVELPWLSEVPAILCMYLAGDMAGQATCELLFGKANPSGKLAETWPVKLEDNPSFLNFPGEDGVVDYREDIFVGYRYYDKKKMEVNFPFGHGLSYTKFSYSDLHTEGEILPQGGRLTVRCTVRNVGERYGKEVVQLYVRDEESRVRRPIRELKGFCKVGLEPGEAKEVTFSLDRRAFCYYEEKTKGWFLEKGTFRIEVGASSRDIRLSAQVLAAQGDELPVCYTRFSAVAELLRTATGREVFEELTGRLGRRKAAGEDRRKDAAMGSGSEKARQTMMMEMPLEAFVTYGVIGEAEFAELLDKLKMEG